jgi:hypothetical protein
LFCRWGAIPNTFLKMKLNIKYIGLALLIILAVVSTTFAVTELYKDYRMQRDIQAYTQGQIDIAKLSISCEPVTIYLNENQSISLIAIGCLQEVKE